MMDENRKSEWSHAFRLMVIGVILGAVLFGLCFIVPSCDTQNATGEEYVREATVEDAHTWYLKRTRYSTTFAFDEALPSGETVLETGGKHEYQVCKDHVGERVRVTFNKNGYVSEVELL